MFTVWTQRARQLRTEVYALVLAYRDPRVPWIARIAAALVVAYALSPIDLIPDPIPVLGYLDDLLIVPLGIALALRLIPAPVMADCRARAQREAPAVPRLAWIAAALIGLLWIGIAALVLRLVL